MTVAASIEEIKREVFATLARTWFVDEDDLLKRGWQYGGYGTYSEVYVRGDYALKVFSEKDYGYREWLTNIPQHGGCYPRWFGSITSKMRCVSPTIFERGLVVILERLQELPDDLVTYAVDLGDAYKGRTKNASAPPDNPLIRKFGTSVCDAIALADSIRVASRRKIMLDIWTNYMIRPSTGELVLTDPLFALPQAQKTR